MRRVYVLSEPPPDKRQPDPVTDAALDFVLLVP
jgi:hypothetical protein